MNLEKHKHSFGYRNGWGLVLVCLIMVGSVANAASDKQKKQKTTLETSSGFSKPTVSKDPAKPALPVKPMQDELCSSCAKSRGPIGSTTIDVSGGFPMFGSLRVLTSVYPSQSPSSFGLSAGLGVRSGYRETMVDVLLLAHLYSHRYVSLALQGMGSLGAQYRHDPLLTNQGSLLGGGCSAGFLLTGKIEPFVYLTLHTAFEFKQVHDISVVYVKQEGPGFETPLLEQVYRSPASLGLLLEGAVEVKVHKNINLFARGGYTFRWTTQELDYAIPQTLLSNWHITAGVTISLPRRS